MKNCEPEPEKRRQIDEIEKDSPFGQLDIRVDVPRRYQKRNEC